MSQDEQSQDEQSQDKPGALQLLRGLGKGLATTAKTLARPAHTRQFPHVEPDLPERSHGVIALLEENCTSCMLCARECPDWCIYIDSHKETLEPTTEGGRARQHNVLDRFDIDFSLCMYCGICIEVCPFDALFWAPDFAYAEGDIRNLLHDKPKLGTWMERVPDSALPEGYERPVAKDAETEAGTNSETETEENSEAEASAESETGDDPETADEVEAAGETETPAGEAKE